jgi:hypothetical protein
MIQGAPPWEGISKRKFIAELNMRTRQVLDVHSFGYCLYGTKKHPGACKRCIIGMLIMALRKRGAE